MIIENKKFKKYISHEIIQNQIELIAKKINIKHETERPIFLVILKGAVLFASDLLKNINIKKCEIEFINATSYEGGLVSTGQVKIFNIPKNLKNRNVIIIEDIVDSGITIKSLIEMLQTQEPKSIEIATLFRSEIARQNKIHCDYVCFESNNEFILGYGLDYKEYGRNLKDIYILDE